MRSEVGKILLQIYLTNLILFLREKVKHKYGVANMRTDYILLFLDSLEKDIIEFIETGCKAPVIEVKPDKLRKRD